ncbi:MAG TPA: glycosyltransferase family 9 protein [Terriglobales bacterium]|nr:glycosyltransferase family 9 protein [Terriglobales bacterium]
MTYRRVLLIHFGQLGDAVLALPAAQALAAALDGAALTVLAGSGAEIFRLAGFRDVWRVDRVGWKRRKLRAVAEIPALLARLRRERFDLSVDLHTYKETNLLAWAAGVPRRVAMLRPTRSLPRLINLRPPPDDPEGPLLDRYCRVLEPLGIAVSDRRPRLTPPPSAQLGLAPPGAAYLGICPGAGHPSRRWPAVNFVAAYRELAAAAAPTPVPLVFAGPEEREEVLAPFRALGEGQVLSGLSLAQLAAALAACRVVLTNASGPSHVAAAVGAAVVTVGEIPAFDPVGRVWPVRAFGSVAAVPVSAVVAALVSAWQAPAPPPLASRASTEP